MKKWILTIAVSVMFLWYGFANSVDAADPASDFEYYESGGEITIADYYGDSKMIIPSKIDGMPVTDIMGEAFVGRKDIEEIVFPACLKSIYTAAFENCTNLKKINLPLDLEWVWDRAFYNCVSLETIVVEAEIMDTANYGYAPDVFTNVGQNTKYGTEVIFKDTVKQISSMFGGSENVNVRRVDIGKNVEIIDGGFYNCTKLEVVNIPKEGKLKEIRGAFQNCTNLKSVVLPESLEVIGISAFEGTTNLRTIDVYSVELKKGAAAFKDAGADVQTGTTVTFHDTVTKIPKNIFSESDIRRVYVGKNVKSIGEDAFYMCDNLEEVTFAEDSELTTIDDWAFEGSGVKSLVLPDKVKIIGEHAFEDSKNLTYLILPESLTELEICAFSGCEKLEYIRISSSIECGCGYESSAPFRNAGDSSERELVVVFDESVETINRQLFYESGAQIAVIGENVSTISMEAFAISNNLHTLIIKESETPLMIQRNSFVGTALKNVILPERVVELDSILGTDLEYLCVKNPQCVIGVSELGGENQSVISGYEGSTIHEFVQDESKGLEEGEEPPYLFEVYEECGTIHEREKNIELIPQNCSVDNTTVWICEHCGEYEFTNEEALGHSYGDWETVIQSTCNAKGRKMQVCSCCGDEKYEELELVKHTAGTWERQSRATIDTNGRYVKRCTDCGDVVFYKIIYKASNVKLSKTSYTYNGKQKTPTVTVKDSKGNALEKNIDYKVSYASGRKNVGKYKVKITFTGADYTGTKILYFKVNPKGVGISSLSRGSKSFTVKWKKPASTYRKQMTGYQIRYSTSSKMTSTKMVTVKSTTSTSKKISKLKANKTYYVQLRTYKKIGSTYCYSGWSTVKKVKTK